LFVPPVTDRCYLEFNMSSKGKVGYRSPLRRWTLMIIILCSAAWRVSADALAQEATPAALTMARPTLWSFEEPESSAAPHLVICMADRVDTQSSGSLQLARDETNDFPRFAKNTISRPVGSVAFGNRAERRDLDLPVLSSLFSSTAGVSSSTDFHTKRTNRPQVIERSPEQASAKVCSLLDDMCSLLDDVPALGSFRYEYRIKYSLSKQWLTDSDSFTHEKSSSAQSSSGVTGRTMKQAAAIILIIAISRSAHAN
jgi:hypothetical protein